MLCLSDPYFSVRQASWPYPHASPEIPSMLRTLNECRWPRTEGLRLLCLRVLFVCVSCLQIRRGYYRNNILLRTSDHLQYAIRRKEGFFHDEAGTQSRNLSIDRAQAVPVICHIQAEDWHLPSDQLLDSSRNDRSRPHRHRNIRGRPKLRC